jgi:hypothetical protein
MPELSNKDKTTREFFEKSDILIEKLFLGCFFRQYCENAVMCMVIGLTKEIENQI